MSNRHRMMRLDQRTGRLERAVAMLEDGQRPGLLVHAREADRFHPQSISKVVGLDRAMVKAPKPELEKGTFNFSVGQWGNSNFTRQQMPVCVFGVAWGTFTYSAAVGGYSHSYGYGALGYGGFSLGNEGRY
jgi:hypothetical protein